MSGGDVFIVKGLPVSGVTPAVLKWARESANMTIDDVARRLKRPASDIEIWENGGDAPTYAQLEALAYDVYKRPLAIFFLPDPPDEPRARAEFRSLPDADLRFISRETTLLIRKARAFQASLVELYNGRNPVAAPIWKQIRVDTAGNVGEQAARIRDVLGVSLTEIRDQPNADAALKIWRRAIERAGIHVFKESFKQREFSGFCLWDSEFPIILINNSTTKTRQIFSLIHELAHVLFDRSGISRFDNRGIEELPPPDREIELFCNRLAAEILVPISDFQLTSSAFLPERATDEQFGILSGRYHVSRSVVLRRFVDMGRASMEYFLAKDREWTAQRRDVESGGNYYATQGAYLSERFLWEVMSRYTRHLLTKSEAAELIGVKPRNFERFEDLVLRGAA